MIGLFYLFAFFSFFKWKHSGMGGVALIFFFIALVGIKPPITLFCGYESTLDIQ